MSETQYLDGFVLPVPTEKIEVYRAIASAAAPIWKEHGALEYREWVGDDLEIEGQIPFPKLAGAKADETIVFAYLVYASKEARDAANAKIMADPRIAKLFEKVVAQEVFDCSRMASGGFRSLVHL